MEQPTQDSPSKNYFTHVASLSMTKVADGLIDPKLVLSWLLATLGASVFLVGLLVPVRESGSLLPQLFTAEKIRAIPVRKWVWVTGSVVQGLAAASIALVAMLFTGSTAGVLIVLLVGILAVARSICSVSYKDVLGKTVLKNSRGKATGTATSVAAAGVLLFGFILMFNETYRMQIVLTALILAGAAWIISAAIFSKLEEAPSETATPESFKEVVVRYREYLRTDADLRGYLWVRGLLIPTAIAPPYLILLAGEGNEGALAQLGALVIASALAGLLSGRIWGKLSDVSTPEVLSIAGMGAAIALIISAVLSTFGWFNYPFVLPVVLFMLMICYQGVRIGRSTHLVDMANEESRAAYTAISNSIIGVALLGTGIFGLIASYFGITLVITLFAVSCVASALIAKKLVVPQA